MLITKHIIPEFVDARGAISKVLDDKGLAIKSILHITSKKGSIRSNHYHKKDSHYCFLVSGKLEWHEKPVGGGEISIAILGAGDLVYTPPMTIHAVRALEDSEFFAFATEARNQDDYEADTVRVTLIQ